MSNLKFSTLILCVSGALGVSATPTAIDLASVDAEQIIKPIQPTYLPNVWEGDGWRGNWFVGIQGGGSIFYGSPLGCSDAFDRLKPLIRANVGKWITPSFGARLQFEGTRFKAADMTSAGYQSYHLDLMWNPLAEFLGDGCATRWSVSPYLGGGLLHNSRLHDNHFAFSYGLAIGYGLTQRLRVNLDFGGMTTFKKFDGYGSRNGIGDHFIGLSAGVSWTFGKAGFRKVVDYRPYQSQSEDLWAYAMSLRDHNSRLSSARKADAATIAELKKILRIEGLLWKYSGGEDSTDNELESATTYPRNDYSGLNSLMARLRDHGIDDTASEDLLAELRSAQVIGAPIYFFFRIGTSQLTDPSQLVNIEEVARIALAYGLKVRVIGAADAATGKPALNAQLSRDRAQMIVSHLQSRGLPSSSIEVESHGGITLHAPAEANRHTRLQLLLP